MLELYPLSYQQRFHSNCFLGCPEKIEIDLKNCELDEVHRRIKEFFQKFEIFRTCFVETEGVKGLNQIIEPSVNIVYLDHQESVSDNLRGVINYTLISQKQDAFKIIIQIPAGKLDSFSCLILAKQLKIYLQKEHEIEEVHQYVDFSCWQDEQESTETSESLKVKIKENWRTLESFCEEKLSANPEFNLDSENDLVRHILPSLSKYRPSVLLKAFSWVLTDLLEKEDVIVDSFAPGRFGLGLDDALGLFEFPVHLEINNKNWDRNIFDEKDTLLFEKITDFSPFAFRIYSQEEVGVEIKPSPGLYPISFDHNIIKGKPVPVLYFHKVFQAGSFDQVFIERLKNTVSLISKKPESPYEFISPGELELSLIRKMTGSCITVPTSKTLLLERILKHCEESSNRMAVTFGDSTLSFRELDEWSECVKGYLIEKNVVPQQRVAVLLPRSEWVLAIIIGILKARAIYTPIDPTYPQDRIDLMLKASSPGFIIKSLDEILNRKLQKKNERLNCFSSDKIYSIFTSGTKGIPNIVDVSHENLTHLFDSLNLSIYNEPFDSQLNIGLNGSFSFDTTIKQWIQLANGSKITILPDEIRLKPDELVQYLVREGINVIDSTPSHLETWINDLSIVDTVSLPITILIGGEPISKKLWKMLVQNKNIHFFNLYGPTECTVDATFEKIDEGTCFPTIGSPLPGVKIEILENNQKRVKIGQKGEIYISGWGVTSGYPNNPELTKEKFSSLAIPEKSDLVAYKSGDLGAWNFLGKIIYKGRGDDQIKVRGHRIEVSELEKYILRDNRIQKIYITKNNQGALIAFIKGDNIEVVEIREFLEKKLPQYAIPSEFIVLSEPFPMNVHGKVDRQKLLSLIPKGGSLEKQLISCPKQNIIHQIMSELLNKNLRVDESFFTAGGDSILAIQLVARAKQFGIKIPIIKLFTHQTSQQLAKVSEGTPILKTKMQKLSRDRFALTPMQSNFFKRSCTDKNHWNQSRFFTLPASISSAELFQAIEKLCYYHPSLKLKIVKKEENWVQLFDPSSEFKFEWIEVDQDIPIKKVIYEESKKAQLSLDIYNGIMLAVKVLKFEKSKTFVFMTVHHLAVDGLSWNILLNDLDTLLNGKSPDSEGAYFSTWVEQLEYYPTQGIDSDFLLPTLSDQHKNFEQEESDFKVDAGLSRFITSKELITEYGLRSEELILGTLYETLSKYIESKKIKIDIESHGRDEDVSGIHDFTRTVGWFTNISSIGIDFEKVSNYIELICAVKDGIRLNQVQGLKSYRIPENQTSFSSVLFNYFGDMTESKGKFSIIELIKGWKTYPDRSLEIHPRYELEIDVYLSNGELTFCLLYDASKISKNGLERFIDSWKNSFQTIITELRGYKGYLWSNSDFPGLKISGDQIRQLIDCEPGIVDILPVTQLQKEKIQELKEDSPWRSVFCIGLSFNIEINVEELKEIWSSLTQRFSTLRTFFRNVQGEVLQLVMQEASFQIQLGNDSGKSLIDMIHEEKSKGFSRKEDPPLRLVFSPGENNSCQIIYTIDLTRLDLTSYLTLFSLAHGALLNLKTSEDHYIDWTPFLRSEVTHVNKAESAFWKSQLLPYVHQSVYNYRIPDNIIPAYTTKKILFSNEKTIPFRVFAKDHSVTLNTLFLAFWALTESQITGNNHPIIGVTLGGRSHPVDGIEKMVGRFVNTLPVHVPIEDNLDLKSCVKNLQINQSNLMNREHITKREIRDFLCIGPESALFQTNFVYEVDPVDSSYFCRYNISSQIYHSSPETPMRIEISSFKSEMIEFRFGYIAEMIDQEIADKYYTKFKSILENFKDIYSHASIDFQKIGVEL